MTNEVFIPQPLGQDDKKRDGDDRPKVNVASHGGSYHGRGELHMDIHGLDTKELEAMKGMMNGHQWVTCRDGRIQNVPTHEELPGPTADEGMMPFWRRPMPDQETQLGLFAFEPLPTGVSPSITIGSLCGYNYSEENYREQAKKLTRWGFICLRSPRDASGGFWEHWHLMGLWAAKEELEVVINTMDPLFFQTNTAEDWLRECLGPPRRKPRSPKTDKERKKRQLDAAVSYLCRNAQFGTLDVSIQQAAMQIPD